MTRTERAWKLIKQEIEWQSRSQYPSDETAQGLIQMALAQNDITDAQEVALTREAAATVRKRRAELRIARIQQCIAGAPA